PAYPNPTTSGAPASAETIAHAQTDYAGSNLENNGIVRKWPRQVRMAQVVSGDGTSNTLMVGEKRLRVNAIGGFQSDDNEGYSSGWDHDVMRNTNKQPLPDYTASSGDGNQRFGSSHTAGFNIVLADGSVKTISFSIN